MITFKAKDKAGEVINSALSPFTFPAGEAHIKREDRRELGDTEIAILQPSPESLHTDLFQLAMWNDYLQREALDLGSVGQEGSKRVLVLPYMPGARADRGNPFGLNVYSDFIRNLRLDQIIIFDPHSGMTGDCLHGENLTIVRSSQLFKSPHISQQFKDKYDGIIAPDKGAEERATAVAGVLGLPVFTVQKTRDFQTGKLSGFDVSDIPTEGTYLLVDDICDGGGTFMGIAKATGLKRSQLDLFVSHGVFSGKAEDNLPDYFRRTFSTNSFNPQRRILFERFDVIHLLLDRIDQPVYTGTKTNN